MGKVAPSSHLHSHSWLREQSSQLSSIATACPRGPSRMPQALPKRFKAFGRLLNKTSGFLEKTRSNV